MVKINQAISVAYNPSVQLNHDKELLNQKTFKGWCSSDTCISCRDYKRLFLEVLERRCDALTKQTINPDNFILNNKALLSIAELSIEKVLEFLK